MLKLMDNIFVLVVETIKVFFRCYYDTFHFSSSCQFSLFTHILLLSRPVSGHACCIEQYLMFNLIIIY
jgi:hypothetical protein